MEPSFEWDPEKELLNLRKHGVSFVEAQLAFLDHNRVIARDISHSHFEQRFYCFGIVERRVLTVRFTYRDGKIRIIGAGFWLKGRRVYEAQFKVHK